MLKRKSILLASTTLFLALTAAAPVDRLGSGFENPPDSAKPQTWWHWMNGNVSKPGITADLEAMKQIGLGGATIVNVDCGIPRGTDGFMTPAWRDDFKFAVSEADRLGLKLCVENCAGWSSSGGPWNTPANAMQRLTATETVVDGPVHFDAVLKKPETNLDTYHDIAVIAFKAPVDAVATTGPSEAPALLEIDRAVFESKSSSDSKDVKPKILELIKGGQKSVLVAPAELGGDPAVGQVKRLQLDFRLDGKPHKLTVDEGDTLIFPTSEALLAKARVAGKSMFEHTFVKTYKDSVADIGTIIPGDSVTELTTRLSPEGRLTWDAPAGHWIVMRVGYTPIGVKNHPSPDEGLGLECDKMSKTALDAHWDGFMKKVLDDCGPLAGKSLESSLIDSYEVGDQDWTPAFREEFIKRRGYDPVKYLPTFGRHVIDSPAVTERFLWDMRRTIADLFAENYFAHFNELCHQHGLNSAVEPYTGPFESLQCGSTSDVVMGEFWTGSDGHPSIKMVSSIAHIYGKTIVGAESFTAGEDQARWQNDPYALKALGDKMFCQGLNRYIFHRYAMQPWTDRAPGMTMGEFGMNFERTQTWWKQGKPWIDYISRCEYLLQQGRTVADVAYFTGESAPVEMRAGKPECPAGYDWDAVNADVLLHGATVENGRIKLKSGASYAVLVLPPDDPNMTPAVLECISKLVHDGATICGPRPGHSPSLADFPTCDDRVKRLADDLWGRCDGKTVLENTAGKGRVVWGRPLADVLESEGLKPDFTCKPTNGDAKLEYVHHTADGAELYFVSNQQRQYKSVDCTFRVTGKTPEIWHPDTGKIEPAGVWNNYDDNGRTTVRINFDPAGSVFILFRQPAASMDHVLATTASPDELVKLPKIEIQHANYVAVDGTGERDVTTKLAELARSGKIAIPVNNDVLGPDPATMHKKELRVEYTQDGKPTHLIVHENDTLTIPPTSSIGQPPLWEMTAAADGKAAIRTWTNGQFDLQTATRVTLHATANDLPEAAAISGSWAVSFPPNLGAPPSVTLDRLMSWTDHPDAEVRYFSGTATYEKEFTVTAEQLANDRELWLDLGEVKNFADVSVNGTDVASLWKPPFRLNVTSAVHVGTNKLVVKVTNLWTNRVIGDEQLPADCEWNGQQLAKWPQWLLDGKPSPTGRITFSTWHHLNKDSELLPSGLIGPVTLRSAVVVVAK